VLTVPTGRYLYAQLRVIPSKYFAVHFDVLTADRYTPNVPFESRRDKRAKHTRHSVV
jgi:hypothetical protein